MYFALGVVVVGLEADETGLAGAELQVLLLQNEDGLQLRGAHLVHLQHQLLYLGYLALDGGEPRAVLLQDLLQGLLLEVAVDVVEVAVHVALDVLGLLLVLAHLPLDPA